jgi:uncharacterized RDD family membrane protein YckC
MPYELRSPATGELLAHVEAADMNVVDVAVSAALLAVGYLVGFAAVSSSDEALVAVASVVTVVLVLVAVPTAVETLTRGRTLGKLALGLRTVRDDAGPISFRHAFVRSLVGVVEIWVLSGVPALLCALVNPRGKRLGDLVAGTFVVRERFPMPRVRPAPMPPQLAGWAAELDLSGLDDQLALAARHYLARAGEIRQPQNGRFAPSLAQEIAETIAKTAVEVLLDRLPDVRLAASDDALLWRPSPWVRGLSALPVAFTPAPKGGR